SREGCRGGFMASIHVRFLEVFPLHEPQGRARRSARAILAANVTKRRARSDAPYHHNKFMAPIRIKRSVRSLLPAIRILRSGHPGRSSANLAARSRQSETRGRAEPAASRMAALRVKIRITAALGGGLLSFFGPL